MVRFYLGRGVLKLSCSPEEGGVCALHEERALVCFPTPEVWIFRRVHDCRTEITEGVVVLDRLENL